MYFIRTMILKNVYSITKKHYQKNTKTMLVLRIELNFLKVLNFSGHTTKMVMFKDELQLRLVLRMLKVLQDVVLESIFC